MTFRDFCNFFLRNNCATQNSLNVHLSALPYAYSRLTEYKEKHERKSLLTLTSPQYIYAKDHNTERTSIIQGTT